MMQIKAEETDSMRCDGKPVHVQPKPRSPTIAHTSRIRSNLVKMQSPERRVRGAPTGEVTGEQGKLRDVSLLG